MYPSDGGSTAGGIPSIPGEPGTLSGAAARLGAAASAVRDWGSQLGSTTSGLSGTTWSGQGAMSFAACVSSLQADHRSAAAALADASSALTAYAAVLAECQSKVKAAQSQVVQAQSSAAAAMNQLNSQPLAPHDSGAAAAAVLRADKRPDHHAARGQPGRQHGPSRLGPIRSGGGPDGCSDR